MPFGIYERVGGSYSLVRTFSLESEVVGSPGFATFLENLAPPNPSPGGRCVDEQGWPVTPPPGGCHAGTFCGGRPSPGLLWTLPLNTVKTWLGAHPHHALVANITPSRPTALLGEIVGIWGYYYPAWTCSVGPWTVIMLKLKMLWVDLDTTSLRGWILSPIIPPKAGSRPSPPYWLAFPAPPKPGRSAFEFFYATYNRRGSWRVGGGGSQYNAPLLYPDALACLFQVIRDELKKDPEACGEGLDLCGCVC